MKLRDVLLYSGLTIVAVWLLGIVLRVAAGLLHLILIIGAGLLIFWLVQVYWLGRKK